MSASRPARGRSGATSTCCPWRRPRRTGCPSACRRSSTRPRLAEALGLRELHIKIEAANPTHSFKDRVVSVASAKALELGLEALACASTGNLAGAVAAQAAALGLEAYIFIPADLEREKIIAASVPGAHIFAVEGTYDDANRLCAELAYERPWAFVNFNVRPYYAQGSKTLAYETAEQLGWRLPDQTVTPIASGSLYTKIDRGFRELLEVGPRRGRRPRAVRRAGGRLLARRDRLRARRGARRARCAPTRSRSRSPSARRPTARTRSGSPARAAGASRPCRDEEVVEAIGLLARTTGYFTETAGGVTVATLARLARAGEIDPDGCTVAYLTGDGLKTPDAALEFVAPQRIAADIDAVDAVLAGRPSAEATAWYAPSAASYRRARTTMPAGRRSSAG